jgi:hypothetical protein
LNTLVILSSNFIFITLSSKHTINKQFAPAWVSYSHLLSQTMDNPPKLPVEDRAYGIIPLRFLPSTPSNAKPSPSNTQILLIHQITTNPNFPRYWGFPKGHAEESDLSPKHTAVRELLEETSLRVELGDILDLKCEGGEEGKDRGKGEDGFGDTPLRQYSVNPYKNIGKETKF